MAQQRYVPRGYIDLEPALVRIASLRNPERWEPELMHPKEREIYAGLGRSYNAEYLADHLSVLVPSKERALNHTFIDRLCDYNDALYEMRRSLHAGEVFAEFVDEHGKFGVMPPQIWGTDLGEVYLNRGVAFLDAGADQLISRLIIFQVQVVDDFARRLHPAAVLGAVPPPAGRRGPTMKPVPRARVTSIFEEWRKSRGAGIPTEGEDISFMKRHGISREVVRELRKTAPKLPRGKPRAKPS